MKTPLRKAWERLIQARTTENLRYFQKEFFEVWEQGGDPTAQVNEWNSSRTWPGCSCSRCRKEYGRR